MNLTWRNPPAHHWYAAKSPGLFVKCRSSRVHQTDLACLRSGHLRSMTFVHGVKSFFTCRCSLLASPAHLLDCWGISLQQLYEEQGVVLLHVLARAEIDIRFPRPAGKPTGCQLVLKKSVYYCPYFTLLVTLPLRFRSIALDKEPPELSYPDLPGM
ncbi:uncharacterized protein TNCV_3411181 [Trichonephila clavipes]|nr:uncharacterized protein TNCV_3411181 [Trichonephila clavipes]